MRTRMQGARDCHGSRILSAGSGGGVPRRECMQCGGIWGTRLDPQVSLGAGLGGAVLVVSPRGMRRKGPGKTSPSQSFWTKKWPDAPLREFHTVSPKVRGEKRKREKHVFWGKGGGRPDPPVVIFIYNTVFCIMLPWSARALLCYVLCIMRGASASLHSCMH